MLSQPGIRVLIVSSDKNVRTQMKNIFQLLGVRDIEVALDGPDAVTAIEIETVHPFDLILCDAKLDNLYYSNVLAAVQKRTDSKGAYFVVSYWESDKNLHSSFINSGADDGFTKPAEIEVIQSILEKTIHKKTLTTAQSILIFASGACLSVKNNKIFNPGECDRMFELFTEMFL